MEAVTQGEAAAIQPLVERYHASLLGFLFSMVGGDRQLAEDLAQETFLRLIRQRTYRADRPFRPWLYAVAANLARDHHRSSRTRGAPAGESDMRDVADPRPGPEARAVDSERSRMVMAALTRLPPEYSATLLLRFFQDFSLTEIAAALDVPIGTVKSRLSVGTRRLRDLLTPEREG